jgi:tetratricopeptide (TPR) repeat protein
MRTPFFVFVLAAFVFLGCGGGQLSDSKDQAQEQGQGQASDQAELPEGHPPMGGASGLGSDAPTDDNALPLKLTGLSSLAELEASAAGTKNKEAREAFIAGYRKTFTADADKRDYGGAEVDLAKAVQLDPNFAEAYRALGYARFNTGFNVQAAMDAYLKAVELKPKYGEAHYALAFMYAMSDLESGKVHFDKAMELGIPDERALGDRYYSGK